MSRKYEIVNVGSVNRVRALRSWVVQGRQVNVGDVGGAVFDERTLSQDGDAWIFSGRLDNPLVRVGGDSVVSIGDVVSPRFPHLNVFGTSSIDANFNVSFVIGNLSSARPLTPAMMENGAYGGNVGQPLSEGAATDQIRTKTRMFTGGGAWAVPAPAAGYLIRVIATDAEGIVIYNSGNVSTAVTVPAGAHAYGYIVVMKSPLSVIVPADVTAAALTFQDYAEATINVVDSHITLTGTGSAGYVMISASGEYQGNVTNIEGSTVQVNRTSGSQSLSLFCDLINTNASITMRNSNISVIGSYRNVRNLVWSALGWGSLPGLRTIVQATDCNNFVMDGDSIPLATANAASGSNLPLVFTRCNMNKALITPQPQINNTYVDINFDLATADLRKLTYGGVASLASSNVNGMYRLKNASNIGALVESYESVKDLNLASSDNVTRTYNTTIYADAYLKGTIIPIGTNVFGNAVKKPRTRTIDVARVAVQGAFNTVATGGKITGVVASSTVCVLPMPVKLRTAKGLTVAGLTGRLQAAFYCTNTSSVITNVVGWGGDRDLTGVTGAEQPQCYIAFHYDNNSAITPADLAGVTIETYNGSKIVNAKTGAMTIAGNVRVEENAVLKDVSVTGSGYFGGESVTEAPAELSAPLPIEGAVYMNDNAVFSITSFGSNSSITRLHMQDNARMTGTVNSISVNLFMKDNAEYNGHVSSLCDIRMEDKTSIPANLGVTAVSYGKFTMKGKASLGANITVKGDITLTGDYRQTTTKAWTGKRVIDSQDAPQYDNNVKTQYDF